MDKFIKFKFKILDSLIILSGIKGFVKPEAVNIKRDLLKKEEWDQAIVITNLSDNIVINLHIVISFDINAKNLCDRIENNIKILSRKNNFKIFKLNIYIRGVC